MKRTITTSRKHKQFHQLRHTQKTKNGLKRELFKRAWHPTAKKEPIQAKTDFIMLAPPKQTNLPKRAPKRALQKTKSVKKKAFKD